MSKKLYFLMSFVLVLGLAGSALAQEEMVWTDGSGDHLWCNPANWDYGLPESNPDITSWETRGIDGEINIAGITDPVLIGPGCNAGAAWVGVGMSTDTGPGVALNMTGGTFELMEIELGQCDGGFGWMTMSGGKIDFYDYSYLSVGSNGGEGRLDMTGGEINLLGETFLGSPALQWAGTLRLPKNEGRCEGNDGVGHLQLDGGIIRMRILQMAENGTMDITGGTLVITGRDSPEVQSWYDDMWDEVISEVNDGDLTAYDGNGVVGIVFMEYFDPNEPNEIWVAGRLDLGAAWLPMPVDGAVDITRDVVLSWQPGDYVQSTNGHKVYFADNFADVNSRAGSAYKGAQTATTYDAGQLETLELSKTYYWAVDEVNGATTWPGDVWSFRVVLGIAQNPYPADGSIDAPKDAVLNWMPGIEANSVKGHDVYFGTNFTDVNDANKLSSEYQGTQDANSWGSNNYAPAGLDLVATYYWRIDEVNGTDRWKGDVWSFEVEGRAKKPYPGNGARGVPSLELVLRWEAGTDAASHDVYFGSSRSEVADANTATAGIFKVHQALSDVNYLVPEDLDVRTTYYWRIDEVNNATLKGHVWSFTTGPFLVVDSFEWYPTDEALKVVWKDYWSDTASKNGGKIFIETDPNFIHGGEKAMKFSYMSNNKHKIGNKWVGSWAKAAASDLEFASGDWTRGGVKALVTYFIGDPCNGKDTTSLDQDRLWVALDDGSTEGVVPYDGDMSAVTDGVWHEWNASLQDFNAAGVDMSNVANVWLGAGGTDRVGQDADGAGNVYGYSDSVYFDDIQLWPPRCMPSVTGLDVLHGLGDVTEDCNTDYFDIELMAEDWASIDGLANTENRPAVLTDFPDTTSHWTTGRIGSGAIEVNEPYNITITDPRLYGLESMSITAWVKQNMDNDYVGIVSSREYVCGGDDSTELGIYGKAYGGPDGLGYDWSCGTEEWQHDADLDVPEDGTWTFIAMSVDPTGCTLYMKAGSGELQTGVRNEVPHPAQQNFAESFWIGRSSEDGGYFKGTIDDVRIYGYSLDEPNIALLANETGEPNPPPVYWYKFDETSGLVAADYGTPIEVYTLNMSPANLVPKDPNESEDPNLGSNAFDPNNLDIVNFRDYRILAEHWLEQHAWP